MCSSAKISRIPSNASGRIVRSLEESSMLIKRAFDIPTSEITSETLFHNRREFIKTASAVLGIAAAGTIAGGCAPGIVGAAAEPQAKGKYDTTEKVTRYEDITAYNNYYEFGTGKDDPARNSGKF